MAGVPRRSRCWSGRRCPSRRGRSTLSSWAGRCRRPWSAPPPATRRSGSRPARTTNGRHISMLLPAYLSPLLSLPTRARSKIRRRRKQEELELAYLLLGSALLLVAVGVLLRRRRRGRRRRRRGAAGEQERPAAANAADDGASDKARLRLGAPQEDAAAGGEHVLRRASHLSLSFLRRHTHSSSRDEHQPENCY
jgi:hypothetical protein